MLCATHQSYVSNLLPHMCRSNPESADDAAGLDHLMHIAFLSELQRVGPGVQEGNVIVDGLFSLLQFRVAERMGEQPPVGPTVMAIAEVSSKHPALLSRYWLAPINEAEMPTYLAVGRSFVEFVLSQFGKGSVAELVKQLGHLDGESLEDAKLTVGGQPLSAVEVKWLHHIKVQSRCEHHLTMLRFTKELLRYCLRGSWCVVFFMLLLFLVDCASYLYNAIAFGEISELAARMAVPGQNSTQFQSVILPISLLFGTLLIRFAAVMLMSALLSVMAVRVSHQLRRRMLKGLHKISPTEAKASHEDLMAAFSQDVLVVETGVGFALVNVVRGIVLAFLSIGYIVAVAWPIGIPLLVAFIILEVALAGVGRRLSHYNFAQGHGSNILSAVAREALEGQMENRVFGLVDYWLARFNRIHRQTYRRKAQKAIFYSQAILALHYFLPLILCSGVLVGGMAMVIHGWLDFNVAMTCFILIASASSALRVSGSFIPTMQNAKASMSKILNMSKEDNSSPFQPDGGMPGSVSHSTSLVDLADVSFAYSPNSAYWQLYKLNLSIAPGQKVAIVGQAGAGKSTLLKLMMGLYQPNEGDVVVCGLNLKSATISALPVGVVGQNSHFFRLTVKENLLLANPEATDNEIEQAVRLAEIHEWIDSLPRGYDSLVGEGAMSNGQRQRLALARALLRNPKLLLLDEVTNALDPSTAKAVFNKIMEVSEGMTVVAVTHSLSQARKFDVILTLSHGVLKEMGNHAELMALKGYYYRLWNRMAVPSDKPIVRDLGPAPNKVHPTPIVSMTSAASFRRLSLPNIHFAVDTPVSSSPIRVPAQLTTVEEADFEHSTMLSQYDQTDPAAPQPLSSHAANSGGLGSHRPCPLQASTPKASVGLDMQQDTSVDSCKSCAATVHVSSGSTPLPMVPPPTPLSGPEAHMPNLQGSILLGKRPLYQGSILMQISTGAEGLVVSGGKEAMTDLEEPLTFDLERQVSAGGKGLPGVSAEGDGPSLLPMTTDM